MTTTYADELAFNIYCIDIDYIRPRLACSYLIAHEGKAAFIDCGTSHSVATLLSSLKERGLEETDVEYVIPTHIHLDHAGGAGALMQVLPNATLIVHPRGARHLVDPQRLVESARQVYGDKKFNTLYGDIIPTPENRVRPASDGEVINLNGRHLVIADTPGHARHHFCIYDEFSHGWFTGDTFGLSYPDITTSQGRYLLPTSTPVQFEPDAWLSSLEILLNKNPQRMFLTHFGMIENVQSFAEKLKQDLKNYTEMATSAKSQPSRVEYLQQILTEYTLNDLAKLGCQQDSKQITTLLSTDLELNAQGLDIWLRRLERNL